MAKAKRCKNVKKRLYRRFPLFGNSEGIIENRNASWQFSFPKLPCVFMGEKSDGIIYLLCMCTGVRGVEQVFDWSMCINGFAKPNLKCTSS